METPSISYLSALAAGLLSFLSPCVLPLIPSYLTYITGLSFSDLDADNPSTVVRKVALFHSLAFVTGFTIVFVLLGASATFLGSFMQDNMVWVRRVGGVLIMLFGVHVTGLIPFTMLLGEKRINLKHKPAGYLGSLLVGLAFAAGWTPCIGPILASILMIAATSGQVGQGIGLLFAYSVGLGIPFVLASLALHRFVVLFSRFKKHIRLFEIITGLFLVVVGLLIFTNGLTLLSQKLTMLMMKLHW